MEEYAEEMGTRSEATGEEKDAGDQVESGKTAIIETGGRGQREWTFVQVDRQSNTGVSTRRVQGNERPRNFLPPWGGVYFRRNSSDRA